MEVKPFSLLNLPNNAVMQVIGTMRHFQIVTFSMISKRTQSLVQNLQLTATRFKIAILSNFMIYVSFGEDYFIIGFSYTPMQERPDLLRVDDTSYMMQVFAADEEYEYSTMLSVRHWMEHLQSIYKCSKPYTMLILGETGLHYETDSLQKTFSDCTAIRVVDFSAENTQKISNLFLPNLNCLELKSQTAYPITDIQIRNWEFFAVETPEQVTLDYLLMFNASICLIEHSENLDSMNIRTFLKSWMKGSHRQMQYFSVKLWTDPFSADTVLKGVKHKEMPKDTGRKAKERFLARCRWLESIHGGYDIRSRYGGLATVWITNLADEDYSRVEVFVWD